MSASWRFERTRHALMKYEPRYNNKKGEGMRGMSPFHSFPMPSLSTRRNRARETRRPFKPGPTFQAHPINAPSVLSSLKPY